MGMRKPKRKTPPSNRTLEKRLWPIFSQFIRQRDSDEGGTAKCISCGVLKYWKEGDCGHYISRSYLPVKYDEMNNHFQCKPCNGFREGNKDEYRKSLVKLYGEQAVLDLEERKHQKFYKLYADDLLKMIEKYKQRLAKMKESD